MPLCKGDKLGPYEILAHIGAGGMGEVYRARDPRCGRAQSSAHRHHLFRGGGRRRSFLTMELVEGQPLDRMIPAGGLAVEQVVEIATALADALAAAHEKGILAGVPWPQPIFSRKNCCPSARPRSVALRSTAREGSSLAFLGLMRAYSGEWEEGCAQVEIAAKLNPNHPGWYRFAAFTNAYRKGQYQEALEAALRVNMPGYFLTYAARSAAYGQLGQHEDAQKALKELLALRPDFARTTHHEFAKWYAPEQVEQLMDVLRKAGLQVADRATIR